MVFCHPAPLASSALAACLDGNTSSTGQFPLILLPGTPDCGEPSLSPPWMDMVCIHAAACDLAIIDEGFRTTVSVPGTGMVAALLILYEQAQSMWPKNNNEAEGMLLLMDLQFARFMAAGISVRAGPCDDPGWQPACKHVKLWSESICEVSTLAAYPVQPHPATCPTMPLCSELLPWPSTRRLACGAR